MLKKFFTFIRNKLKSDTRDISPTTSPEDNASQTQPAATDLEQATAAPRTAGQAHEKKNEPKDHKKYRKQKPKKKNTLRGWDISNFDVPPVEGKSRFHDFNPPLELMRAIADLDFKYCTPIQAMTLGATMKGSDAIGRAQTGTGKTAAFLVTILSKILNEPKKRQGKKAVPRALIIAPTRELVIQIAKDGRDLAKYCQVSIVPVFGGMDYEKQQLELEQQQADIIAATPGRLLDFHRQGRVDLGQVEILVIDEADRMLDMGFIPDVTRIVQATPPKKKRQTLMFSATMTPEVKRLAARWCDDPLNVEIAPEQVAVETVKQIIYLTSEKEKYAILYNMITGQQLEKVLVFANRRDETRKLTDRLKRNQISCAMLSGEVAQKKRMKTLEDFREGRIKVLVATDVAGRGIHVEGITHVFNYNLPYEAEDYVHRIGRTGRAGKAGVAISFADEESAFYLPAIEEYIETKLSCDHPDDELLKPPPRGTAQPVAQKKSAKQGRPGKRRRPSRRYKPRSRPRESSGTNK